MKEFRHRTRPARQDVDPDVGDDSDGIPDCIPEEPPETEAPGSPSEPGVPGCEGEPQGPEPSGPEVGENPGGHGEGGGEHEKTLDALKQTGQMKTPDAPESNIHVMSIIGQIEGHMVLPQQNKTTKYEHVIPQLVAIEQNPKIEGLLLILNTVGGDVEAGLAIAEMVESMSKPTVSLVLGGGHSIGVPIAVSSAYSYIAYTATMTIHPLRLTGLVIGVPQTYEYLDKMQDRVIRFITCHSGMTDEKLRELMFRIGELMRDVGTVLIGPDAVKVGLIDEVGGLSDSLAKLNELIALKREGKWCAERAKRCEY